MCEFRYYDMHCHLGVAACPYDYAQHAAKLGLFLFSGGLYPNDYAELVECGFHAENVALGWGWHPWYVSQDNFDGTPDSDVLIPYGVRLISEIGLDFSRTHEATKASQEQLFSRIVETCAERGNCLLSVHAVLSVTAVLDILEEHGAFKSNRVVFHWFSGSSLELQRALALGCYMSINPNMLTSKRGREYIRVIPEDRLLIESDYSAEDDYHSAKEHVQALEQLIVGMADIRSTSPEELRAAIAQTSKGLLSFSSGSSCVENQKHDIRLHMKSR